MSDEYESVTEVRIQANYVDGLVVRYNTLTDTLSVLNYGFGLDFNYFKLGTYNLTNTAYFISRTVNRNLISNGNFLRAAIALYAPGEFFTSVFEHLQAVMNQSPNYKEIFPATYTAQCQTYGGKTIQGITVDSESDKLNKSGHFINLFGEVKYLRSVGFDCEYAYKYTCSHYL